MTFLLSLVLLATASPVASPPAPAAALRAEEVVRRVIQANAELTSWSASFRQRRHYVHFDQTDERSGRITYQRGSGLRIDVDEPQPETIIVGRSEALQWSPRTRQLHIYPLPAGSDAQPLPIPIGNQGWDPARDHDLRLLESPDETVVLELTPRSPTAAYQTQTLWLDPTSWHPVQVQLVEATDDVVHYSFTEIQRNQPVDHRRFTFAPPAGAEVVRQDRMPSLFE